MAVSINKWKLIFLTVLTLSLLSILAVPVAAQLVTLDLFSTDQPVVRTSQLGMPTYGHQDGDMLGSERDIMVECTGGNCLNRVYSLVVSSKLSHNQGIGALGYSLVVWDGNDDDASSVDYAGLNHTDLTADGADRFRLTINSADLAGSGIMITVYTDSSHWSVASATNIPATATPTDYFFPYSDFTPGTGASGPADFTDVGAVTLMLDGRSVASLDMAIGLFVTTSPPRGTGTPGYWKNHPDAWPVDEITLGGMTYSKAEAIAILKHPIRRDMTYAMAQAFIAAKLNVLIGNESSCVDDAISAADAWFVEHPVGSGVSASSPAWEEGEPYKDTMDAYNNGLLCAPHRD